VRLLFGWVVVVGVVSFGGGGWFVGGVGGGAEGGDFDRVAVVAGGVGVWRVGVWGVCG